MFPVAKKKFQRFGPIYRDPIPRYHVGARQRSLLVDNDLNIMAGGDFPAYEISGDNFSFLDIDAPTNDLRFALRSQGNNKEYLIWIVGAPGFEQIQIDVGSDQTTGVPPIPNSSAGFQFTNDLYFRLVNLDNFASFHHINMNDDGTMNISVGYASNFSSVSYTNGFNFLIIGGSFYFLDPLTGNKWKPWIIDDGVGGLSIECTLTP